MYVALLLCFLQMFCQGEHLQRGSRLVDFDIRLGDSVCVPVSLTDSQVECRPPTNKRNGTINNTSCQDDTLSTDVCIHAIYYVLQINLEKRQTKICFRNDSETLS